MSGAMSASTVLSAVGMGVNAVGAYNQSQGTQAAYNYQASVNANNAQLAEWQAQDALVRGAKAEQARRLNTAQVKGTQRATLAARGVAIDEGSALNILNDTDYIGEIDAATVRDNAKREAWGYRNQGAGYTSDAAMLSARASAESPLLSGASSLLTSAGSVADSWYKRKAVGIY